MLAALIAMGVFDAANGVLADPPASRTYLIPSSSPFGLLTTRKTPGERLDYKFMLDEGVADRIVAQPTISAVAGVTVEDIVHDDTVVTFWLSGGRAPSIGTVSCIITAASGRILEGRVRLVIA